MNDPVAGSTGMPYVSRGRRRRLVLAMYLCMAAVVLWFAFGGNHWSVGLAIVPLVAVAILWFELVVPIKEALTEEKDPELDERQLAVRNRAYFYAFRVLGLMAFGAVLYGASAAGLGGPGLPMPRTTPDFGLLGLLVAFLLGSLPASAAAWTEPDPPLDEED